MIISGLSGNEIYCLAQKGLVPGNIVVGNSVQSLGFFGGISRSFQTLSGGESTNLTQLITEGRHAAIGRMEKEAQDKGAHGVTGVMSDLKNLSGMQEFIAIGSAVSGLQPDSLGSPITPAALATTLSEMCQAAQTGVMLTPQAALRS